MKSLIAKVKGLKQDGISAYFLTGSYEVPVETATDSIKSDFVMVDEKSLEIDMVFAKGKKIVKVVKAIVTGVFKI